MASEDTIIGVELKYGDDGNITAECRAELVKVSDWLSFWAKFELVVHNNSKMNEISKWFRLEQCLVGDAKRWIANLKPSKDNYLKVVSLMREYFESADIQQKSFNDELA